MSSSAKVHRHGRMVTVFPGSKFLSLKCCTDGIELSWASLNMSLGAFYTSCGISHTGPVTPVLLKEDFFLGSFVSVNEQASPAHIPFATCRGGQPQNNSSGIWLPRTGGCHSPASQVVPQTLSFLQQPKFCDQRHIHWS